MDFGEVALGAVAGMELESPLKVNGDLVKSDDPEVTAAAARMSEKARERQLVGSLTTTYKFKGSFRSCLMASILPRGYTYGFFFFVLCSLPCKTEKGLVKKVRRVEVRRGGRSSSS